MRSAVLSFLAAALLMLATAAGAADPPPTGARLEYLRGPGAENCPGEEGLRDAVAAQMGGADPFTKAASKRVVVTITRPSREYQGDIALYDETGHLVGVRPLSGGSSCEVLIQNLATSIHLMLQPFGPSAAPLASSTPPPPALPPATRPPLPPAPPPPKPERPLLQLSLGTMVVFDAAPLTTAGFAGSAGVRWPWFSLVLEGRGYLGAATEPRMSGASIETSLFTGALVPCLHRSWFEGCAVLAAGVMRGTVSHAHPQEQLGPYGGGGLRLGIEVPFSAKRFALSVSGDVLVGVNRPTVRIGQQEAWKMPPTTETLGLRGLAFF